jgi:hypothetical protein
MNDELFTQVNRERIALLVEALESDRFKQCRKVLEWTGEDGTVRQCCLGVACRVAMIHGLDVTVDLGSGDEDLSATYFDGESSVLPDSVRQWFGFEGHNPLLRMLNGTELAATAVNDSYGWSFEMIADAFRRTYLDEAVSA